MRKLTVIVFISMIAFAFACGGTPDVKTDMGSGAIVKMQNEQLARIPVEGFDYKSSNVPSQKWDMWASAAAPVVKGVIDKLPEGHVLQVTGHTDARGPERPVGAKPGNIKISTDRAKAVHDSLRTKGISSPNMTYKGVGSSELIPGVDPNSAEQRRVTFKVVPK